MATVMDGNTGWDRWKENSSETRGKFLPVAVLMIMVPLALIKTRSTPETVVGQPTVSELIH